MKPKPSISLLRECISYDQESGICTLRKRPRGHFNSDHQYARWNTRFEGKEAGCRCAFGSNEYKTINFMRQTLKAHRVIWAIVTGGWPVEIDHVDGNGLNNKWENLRNVSTQRNMMNKRRYKNKAENLPTGIFYVGKKQKMFVAQITFNNKQYSLGSFKNLDDAVLARKQAEIEFGFTDRHGSS